MNDKNSANTSTIKDRRPLIKKKLNSKLTDASTIQNVYYNKSNLRKALVGIDKKNSKIKLNKKLGKRMSKNQKRKEYKLIDLTLNHQDDNGLEEDPSELNLTTTEGSLPPLENSSHNGSEKGKNHNFRYSRSHQRPRETQKLKSNIQGKKRKLFDDNSSTSKKNEIDINEKTISLAMGSKPNMRSDILNMDKSISFENPRSTNKSEIKGKRFYNSSMGSNTSKNQIDKPIMKKMTKDLKLRKFSKSDKKNPDSVSVRSGSRKSRALSKASSKALSNASSLGKINLQEFSKLKYENKQLKFMLGDMVSKFQKFKSQMSLNPNINMNPRSSDSGSSHAWKEDKLIAQMRKEIDHLKAQLNSKSKASN